MSVILWQQNLFGAGSGTNLTVQNGISGSSGDNVVLIQLHILVVQDGSSASRGDNVVLTITYALAIDDGFSSSQGDNVTLLTPSILVIQGGYSGDVVGGGAMPDVLIVNGKLTGRISDNYYRRF